MTDRGDQVNQPLVGDADDLASPRADGASSTLLSVQNLRTQFPTTRGVVHAVDGVSFDLAAGQTFGVVGESGSGKSVLVRTIMNLLPSTAIVPDSGRITYRAKNLRTMPPHESKHFWGPEMAMVFQDPMTALNPVRKIGAQVTESMRFHLGLSKHAATDRALDLLNEVGVNAARNRLTQYPHELSGGLRQRIVIAIALACNPNLLIADEPTTALDVTTQRQILDLLCRLQADRGMAMIIISHDLGVISGVADRVAVMYAGQFVEVADSSTLLTGVHHPYTDALLASMPRLGLPPHSRLTAIPGRPPELIELPPGCRFGPRCRHSQADCEASAPILEQTASGHLYRCIHPLNNPVPVPVPVVREHDRVVV